LASIGVYAQNPLPVELTSFTAKLSGGITLVKWSTASEINNDYFIVERSRNGIDFLPLVRVNTHAVNGNSTSPLYYDSKDNAPYKGISYYRLKQTDLNGNENVFDIVTVNCIQKNNLLANLYPNPATNEITLELSPETSGNLHVQILDITGRVVIDEVHSISSGNQELKISLAEIVNGIYYLQVSSDETGYSYTTKLIKN